MANKMITCKTCGAEIAKNAKTCPSCGAKNKKGKKKLLIILVLVIVIGIFFIALGSSDSDSTTQSNSSDSETVTLSESEFKSKCESIAYKDIARNPADYEGKYVKFKGKVIQVQENKYTDSIYRIDVTEDEYGFWDDTVYVTYRRSENETRILEDDIVVFYGICQGTESYTSVLGGQVTIPSVHAEYLDVSE